MTNLQKFSYIVAFCFTLANAPAKSAPLFYPKTAASGDSARKPEVRDAKQRSPRKATLLAIVPGLGQGYNGDLFICLAQSKPT
ncbi:MAG: hypothetical protein J7619_30075 [Dyadobacter sp.]|uniref:hypothetical protein n=1 Tax=Dyadobacter sp. TaxID=1914288 RepID=UPI001B1A85F1|nr:hypothetical protein [Dyadobacter sp.]MBO9616972.1 hypothetical protein [Dyadobacter sp.]